MTQKYKNEAKPTKLLWFENQISSDTYDLNSQTGYYWRFYWVNIFIILLPLWNCDAPPCICSIFNHIFTNLNYFYLFFKHDFGGKSRFSFFLWFHVTFLVQKKSCFFSQGLYILNVHIIVRWTAIQRCPRNTWNIRNKIQWNSDFRSFKV